MQNDTVMSCSSWAHSVTSFLCGSQMTVSQSSAISKEPWTFCKPWHLTDILSWSFGPDSDRTSTHFPNGDQIQTELQHIFQLGTRAIPGLKPVPWHVLATPSCLISVAFSKPDDFFVCCLTLSLWWRVLERCIPSFRLELEWTPVRKKEEWNPSLQLQQIQDSHVGFALDFSGIVHVSFFMVFRIGACLTLRMICTIYV